jgi:hypothetical protein
VPLKIISKRRVWIVLLLCAGIGLWFVSDNAASRNKAQWLSSPPIMRSRLAFLGRWHWPVKRQLLRVKDGFLGPAKSVLIAGTILEFDAALSLTNLSGTSATLTNASGSQLFVSADAGALSNRFIAQPGTRILSAPRVITSEKAQAQLAISERVPVGSGTNVHMETAGCWLDVWPRVNAQSIDLACFLTVSERALRPTNSAQASTNSSFVQTNAAFGARARIPRNGGLLLISGSTNQSGKRVGVILFPKVLTPAGK